MFQYISNFFCCNKVSIHRTIICYLNIHYGLQHFSLELVKIYYVQFVQNQLPVCITMWQEKNMQLSMIHVISNFQLYRLALYVVLYLPYN